MSYFTLYNGLWEPDSGLCVTTQKGGMGLGGEVQDRGAHVLVGDSCCCMVEANAILQSNIFNVLKFKNKHNEISPHTY